MRDMRNACALPCAGGDTRLADRVERLQYLRAREGDAALLKPLLMYTNVW